MPSIISVADTLRSYVLRQKSLKYSSDNGQSSSLSSEKDLGIYFNYKINFSTFFGTLALERSDGRLTKFEE